MATPITILTYGAQTDAGTSAAFDAVAYSTIRSQLQIAADQSLRPELDITVEHAPATTGPWRSIFTRRYVGGANGEPYGWDADRMRFILSAFDRYLRVTWSSSRRAPAVPLQLNLGLTGDAV